VQRSGRTRDRRRAPRRPQRRLLERSADERLVDLVLAGDETAFDELFERHAPDALWFAREVLGSWNAAEEAVRHSFAAAHAYLDSRDPDVEFAPWLHTILSNHCLSVLQARAADPGESRDAAVVDLEVWRRRRHKLLGGALPLSPSAGLHESVMTACGFGTAGAAATAAAPLFGGTLAKVAMVAVLATGAGVAGDVATQRADRPDGGVRVVATQEPGRAPAASSEGDSVDGAQRDGAARTPTIENGRDLRSRPRREGDGPSARGDASIPAHVPADTLASNPPGLPAAGGVEAPLPADPQSPTADAVQTPVRAALDTAKELVSADDPVEPTPAEQTPAPTELQEIGDALAVTPAKSVKTVHGLLQRVVARSR
jgi:hypothetical protein